MLCIPTTHETVRQFLAGGEGCMKADSSHAKDQCASIIWSTLANLIEEFLQPYLEKGDRVCKVRSCRAYYSVILFDNGTLIVFSPMIPALHEKVLSAEADPVVDVDAGDYHIVFCTKSGAVYSCGYSNRYGQCGDGTVWERSLASQPFREANTERKGSSLLPLLSPIHRVPGFGVNTLLQGFPNISTTQLFKPTTEYESLKYKTSSSVTPISFSVNRATVRICAVSCGTEHTLLLSESLNGVYSCGRGHQGQLGLRRCPVPLQPVFRVIPLSFGLPIKQILAAGHHSFFLTHTGHLFGFGENQTGQLGVGFTRNVFVPTLAKFSSAFSSNKTSFEETKETKVANTGPLLMKSPLKKRAADQLDSKAYTTLHASYASLESVYYPLRIKRLRIDREPEEPFIEAVWGCATTTIALTKDLDWLSCGLPVTRSWISQEVCRSSNCKGDRLSMFEPRHDGYGALGRQVSRVEDAWCFGRIAWSVALRQIIRSLNKYETSAWEKRTETSVNKAPVTGQVVGSVEVECVSYPHLTVVMLKDQGVNSDRNSNNAITDVRKPNSFIFMQSSIFEAVWKRKLPAAFRSGEISFDTGLLASDGCFVSRSLSVIVHPFLKSNTTDEADFAPTPLDRSADGTLTLFRKADVIFFPLRQMIVLM